MVTFFTACFTLDEKRLQQNKDGALICYKHKNYSRNSCSQRQISNQVFEFIYSNVIFTAPVKVRYLSELVNGLLKYNIFRY